MKKSILVTILGVTVLVLGGMAAALGTVGTAAPVPGLSGLSSGDDIITSVSCGPDGHCSAIGRYTNANGTQGFVVDTANGAWADAIPIPGLIALNAGSAVGITQVSCGPGGHCMAVGTYSLLGGGLRSFSAERTDAGWTDAIPIPGLDILDVGEHPTAVVSCPTIEVCVIGGSYRDGSGNSQGFVAEKRNGTWTPAQPIAGLLQPGGLNNGAAVVTSISCATADSCSAVGTYTAADSSKQSFVVDRGPGGWGNAIAIPGLVAPLNQGSTEVVSVSCAAVDDCSATGTYDGGNGTHGFVVDRGPGGWGNAIAIPGLTSFGTGHFPVSIDCATAGSCAVAGWYFGQEWGGFVADRTNGTWTSAIPMAGLPVTPVTVLVNQVACADASTCAAIGSLFDPSAPTPRWEAFLNQRTGGTWGTVASVPGLSALGGEIDFEHLVIACVRNGNCVSGGGHSVTPSTAPPYVAFLTQFVPMSTTTTAAPSTTVPDPTTTTAIEPAEPRFTG